MNKVENQLYGERQKQENHVSATKNNAAIYSAIVSFVWIFGKKIQFSLMSVCTLNFPKRKLPKPFLPQLVNAMLYLKALGNFRPPFALMKLDKVETARTICSHVVKRIAGLLYKW